MALRKSTIGIVVVLSIICAGCNAVTCRAASASSVLLEGRTVAVVSKEDLPDPDLAAFWKFCIGLSDQSRDQQKKY